MKNINLLLFIAIIIMSSSCSKNENMVGMDIAGVVSFSIVDKQGSDLLIPNSVNYFETNNTKILNIVDGKLKVYSEALFDVPRGFRIHEPNEFVKNYIFSLHATQANGYADLNSTAYIQWNDTDTDTIQCQFTKEVNSFRCVKVWYNGKEVWDISKGYGLKDLFTIIK